jgi:hypothetical protein
MTKLCLDQIIYTQFYVHSINCFLKSCYLCNLKRFVIFLKTLFPISNFSDYINEYNDMSCICMSMV